MGSRSSTKALVDQARQVMTAIEYPALTTAEKKKLLLAFNLKCAFCGGLYSGPRVEPVDPAGLRVPGNLVPACSTCRQYRRVNEGWRAFMARRVQGNTEKYERLAAQMEAWLLANPLPPPMTSPVITAAHQRVEEALATIADACRDLRAECRTLRRSQRSPAAGEAPTPRADVGPASSSEVRGPTPPTTVVAPASPRPESGRARLLSLVDRRPRGTPPARCEVGKSVDDPAAAPRAVPPPPPQEDDHDDA